MDPTLRAILSELVTVSMEVDRLRARILILEQEGQEQVADFQKRLAELENS